jgi:hypothetical protein
MGRYRERNTRNGSRKDERCEHNAEKRGTRKHALSLGAAGGSGNARKCKKPLRRVAFCENYAGNHLISHTLSRAVPSAQRGLTSVFGMGTGGTLAVWSPANLRSLKFETAKTLGALGGLFLPQPASGYGFVLPRRSGKLAPFNSNISQRNRLSWFVTRLVECVWQNTAQN